MGKELNKILMAQSLEKGKAITSLFFEIEPLDDELRHLLLERNV
jgi:hypothetical protein